VKGHSGDKMNDLVDELATKAADSGAGVASHDGGWRANRDR
jgi:ribonuclease HI